MDTAHLVLGSYDELVVEATGSGLRLTRSAPWRGARYIQPPSTK